MFVSLAAHPGDTLRQLPWWLLVTIYIYIKIIMYIIIKKKYNKYNNNSIIITRHYITLTNSNRIQGKIR